MPRSARVFADRSKSYIIGRRCWARHRRIEILNAWSEGTDILARGAAARLAERFGVHRSTISRDIRIILKPEWPDDWGRYLLRPLDTSQTS